MERGCCKSERFFYELRKYVSLFLQGCLTTTGLRWACAVSVSRARKLQAGLSPQMWSWTPDFYENSKSSSTRAILKLKLKTNPHHSGTNVVSPELYVINHCQPHLRLFIFRLQVFRPRGSSGYELVFQKQVYVDTAFHDGYLHTVSSDEFNILRRTLSSTS